MAINFPTSLDTLPKPPNLQAMNQAGAQAGDVVSDLALAIEALQAKVGANASAVNTSLDYFRASVRGTGGVPAGAGVFTTGAFSGAISATGNAGIGAASVAWLPGVYTAIDLGAASAFGGYAVGASGDALTFVMCNAFFNSSNVPIYKKTGFAANYRQFNGMHQFFTAQSGTEGTAVTFTQNATLDSTGLAVTGAISATTTFNVAGTQVLSARKTGWVAQTATASRADLGSSPTAAQIASFCRALRDDLVSHGLLGA